MFHLLLRRRVTWDPLVPAVHNRFSASPEHARCQAFCRATLARRAMQYGRTSVASIRTWDPSLHQIEALVGRGVSAVNCLPAQNTRRFISCEIAIQRVTNATCTSLVAGVLATSESSLCVTFTQFWLPLIISSNTTPKLYTSDFFVVSPLRHSGAE